ncbi:3-hydroxyacyl-CoA dehydrogenase [Herbidospora cretacea]|uniref:3-hydroxyacyl-CoA dehydrogenase n=1 Tax=Herbidospora cretacea TaxID=28444 RepID=UPI0007745892|nr:3-hydroxyacyl-CoA dehydrogenase NAD-binding domain-containing protein [Herbidospora cretacea]
METVGVAGLGTMGAGIAEVFARAGLRVIGVEADEAALARGRGHLEGSTGRAVARGKLSPGEREAILGRVTLSADRAAFAEADLVVEAIPELMELKLPLFADLDRICKPEAILATNTSSLPVTEIALRTGRPERVVGMHFFNPAPVMRLVEVVGTARSTVTGEVADLARRIGKRPVVVGDRPGFVVNRLLLGYLNHACQLLDQKAASKEAIDTAMVVQAGLPMGPFALLDLIGLDTALEICGVLHRDGGDPRHEPAKILTELVGRGRLGRKSGGGFHDGEPEAEEGFDAMVLLRPYLVDAIDMFTSGYASQDDIDEAMKLGCGYRSGPFETIAALRMRSLDSFPELEE